ncbi:MAG: SDR family NAD(P)-dependent oxidoreductase [Bacteroidetes bacterium]|nr:SDR family NAD(P)-dependent oxidoreductase [Bacteroidota bacterium]
MNKTVLITGATAGIGEACAHLFAANGYNLIITGRRKSRLQKLKETIQLQHPVAVDTCCFDVQKREDVFTAINQLPGDIKAIDILINNAGLALGKEPFDEADIDDWETMMHTNVDGLLYVSRAVLPLLKQSKQPHIINLASIAGKEVYENGNVYCASKYAVDALTKAMRIDLLKHGIKVTGIYPGAVETEFSLVRFKGDTDKAGAAYKGLTALTAGDIADSIFYCASLPPHVCINELVITCLQQAGTYYFYKT